MFGLWHNIRLLGFATHAMIVIALVAIVSASLGWLISLPYFELRHVQIGAAPGSALRHVNQPTLIDSVRRAPSGNFFTVDMTQVKETVEEVPWVRHATVRRLWPDTLVVMIEEHRAAALWEDSRLISVYGELFTANLDEAIEDGPLPQLGGPDGTEHEVMARFVELRQLVEPLDLEPVSVTLSARRAWTAKLDDGTELLIGKKRGVPIAQRVRRWVESYPLVTERMQRLASVIDLRYPNGYTVRSLELLANAYSPDNLIEPVALRDSVATAVLGTREAAAAVPAAIAPIVAPAVKPKAKDRSRKKATKKKNSTRAAAAKAKKRQQAAAAKRAKAAKLAKAKRSSVQKPRRVKSRKSSKPSKATAQANARKPQVKLGKKPSAAELKEIRRAATRRAAARHAERARREAQKRREAARRKAARQAAAQKRSEASDSYQPQMTGSAA
ncbi:MAG: cell division protein FtsQ/DivIB [Burkholderiaceae bacterium]